MTETYAQNFTYLLKKHLLRRLPGRAAFKRRAATDEEIASVRIMHDRFFEHKVFRVNYDTYDMRRDQDSINPDTHPDVMFAAPPGSGHPFIYARVLRIFHVYACRVDEETTTEVPAELVQVLWVRWFELDPSVEGGFAARRLHRLRWPALDDEPFGFVLPKDVIRGCHLMADKNYGQSESGIPGPTLARPEDEDLDWKFHRVGM